MKNTQIPANTDFKEGSQITLDNAKKHFAVALTSRDISFGIANSHLILALEEAAKADMLDKLATNRDWLNYIDFDKYFLSHNHKHKEGLKYLSVDYFLLKFLEKIDEVIEENKKLNLSRKEIEKRANDFSNEFPELIDSIKSNTHTQLKTHKYWFDIANYRKNLGFYVNLGKVNGIWNGPFDITQELFEESMKIVADYIEHIEKAINFSQD